MKARLFSSAAILLGFVACSQAAVLTVLNTGDNGSGSLRQAMIDAVPGDTINFSLPVNSVIALTSAQLVINKNLTITGPGANLLTVQRSAVGGILTAGTLALVNVTISGNSASAGGNGGGIFNNFGVLTLSGSTVSGNTVSHNTSAGSSGPATRATSVAACAISMAAR